jgi:D-inositol-3-phosphate glycosyltransferase
MTKRAISIVQALLFYPRGGSAQVIHYLTNALKPHAVTTRIVSGSAGQPGDSRHAATFFNGNTVSSIDYSPAMEAAKRGRDPISEPVPLHPSYEDREGVPDRIFTAVSPEICKSLEKRWTGLFNCSVNEPPDLFHVHHLTPLQVAVRANWPDTPMIGHIHGTELKMLQLIEKREALLTALGLDFDDDPADICAAIECRYELLSPEQRELGRSTRWSHWRYSGFWRERLRKYAAMCDRLIVLTDEACEQSAELLSYDPARIHPVPNGVDIARFTPDRLSPEQRLERWRHWLVHEPRGWDESGVPGSVRYEQSEVDAWFVDGDGDKTPVLFFVGRFTDMKRVPLLIRAYHRAQSSFNHRAPLVIWGGSPGEWEGEHPVTVAREQGVKGVFFIGWRGHNELPSGLNAADVMVAPSTNEPFGQVYLEAMACELPVIATQSGGPPSFINRRNGFDDGWLVPPDDEASLADAIVEAVNAPDERKRRGKNALVTVRERYSWTQVAGTVRDLYDEILESR